MKRWTRALVVPVMVGGLLTGGAAAFSLPRPAHAAATTQGPSSLTTLGGTNPAAARHSCDDHLNDPHYTKRGHGAIAKLTYTCYGISWYHYDLHLWVCRDKPRVEFPGIWVGKHCHQEGHHQSGFNPARGKKYTRYVPRRGSVGHGCGYWVANDTVTYRFGDWNGFYYLHSPHHPRHCW